MHHLVLEPRHVCTKPNALPLRTLRSLRLPLASGADHCMRLRQPLVHMPQLTLERLAAAGLARRGRGGYMCSLGRRSQLPAPPYADGLRQPLPLPPFHRRLRHPANPYAQ